MVQTRSDAPAHTGTAPAAAAAVDTSTVRVDSTSKIGDSTSTGDGISSSSLGAGDPKEDLDSVKSLNKASKGTDGSLGLPSCEIHDPLNESADIGAGVDGGVRGGALNADSAVGDQVDGTTNGALDSAPKTGSDANQDDPNIDAPITKDVKQRIPNPRDASPFGTMGQLGHSSAVGNADSHATINSDVQERNRIQQIASATGGASGIASLGSSGAAAVVRNAVEAAHGQQPGRQPDQHHGQRHQRQPLRRSR